MIDQTVKLVICWLQFCCIWSSHLTYAVHSCFCAQTDSHLTTRHYPLGITGSCTNLLLLRFSWELTVFPWKLQGSHHFSIQSLSSTVCLNYTVIHKYLINTELYLNFWKNIDKLFVVKNLAIFTLFNQKKKVKKRYYRNECFCFAWDRITVH